MAGTETRDTVGPPGLLYLAGPIDFVSHEEAINWRDQIAERLYQLGLSTFSPAHAFTVCCVEKDDSEQLAKAIIGVNRAALRHSNAVIACVDGNSFGTPIECMEAFVACIPVFAFGGVPNSVYRHHFACWEPDMETMLARLRAWQYARQKLV